MYFRCITPIHCIPLINRPLTHIYHVSYSLMCPALIHMSRTKQTKKQTRKQTKRFATHLSRLISTHPMSHTKQTNKQTKTNNKVRHSAAGLFRRFHEVAVSATWAGHQPHRADRALRCFVSLLSATLKYRQERDDETRRAIATCSEVRVVAANSRTHTQRETHTRADKHTDNKHVHTRRQTHRHHTCTQTQTHTQTHRRNTHPQS
jgi:hypothetical protein